jgi:hypothetical protein
MASQLVPSDNADDRAIEIMIGEKKSITEARDTLKREGFGIVSLQHLQTLKKNAFDSLVKQYKSETTAEFMLDSIRKITLEFEDLYEKFKRLSDQFEREDKPLEQLLVLKELRTMVHMALKRLGEYKTGIEKSQESNVYISNSDVILMVKEAQEKIFSDSNPSLVDGKIILTTPSSEIIDSFHRWKFKNSMRLPDATDNKS